MYSPLVIFVLHSLEQIFLGILSNPHLATCSCTKSKFYEQTTHILVGHCFFKHSVISMNKKMLINTPFYKSTIHFIRSFLYKQNLKWQNPFSQIFVWLTFMTQGNCSKLLYFSYKDICKYLTQFQHSHISNLPNRHVTEGLNQFWDHYVRRHVVIFHDILACNLPGCDVIKYRQLTWPVHLKFTWNIWTPYT